MRAENVGSNQRALPRVLGSAPQDLLTPDKILDAIDAFLRM